NAAEETRGCRVGAKLGVGFQILLPPGTQPQALRVQDGYVERGAHFFFPGKPGRPRTGGAPPGRPGRPGSFGKGRPPPSPGRPAGAPPGIPLVRSLGSWSLRSLGKLSSALGSRRASSPCIFSSSAALGPLPPPIPIAREKRPPRLPIIFIMSAILRCILSRRLTSPALVPQPP